MRIDKEGTDVLEGTKGAEREDVLCETYVDDCTVVAPEGDEL